MLGLLTVLCGFVVSLALAKAGRGADGYSPVHFVNIESNSRVGQQFNEDSVPVLVSHFLGDNSAAVLADQEAVLQEFPSRFMDSVNAAVLVVENLDLNQLEPALGSARLYFADRAASALRSRARLVSVPGLVSALELPSSVLWLDAVEHGVDYSSQVLQTLRETSVRVLLVANPKSDFYETSSDTPVALRNDLLNLKSRANHTSYIQIPSSFSSEDACIAQTNACSQRGQCIKSSAGRWACQCVPTKEGDRTTYWGGSDCTKRDVSFQFNLLVGTTLAVVVAATLSVALLFNLGKENGVPDTVKL